MKAIFVEKCEVCDYYEDHVDVDCECGHPDMADPVHYDERLIPKEVASVSYPKFCPLDDLPKPKVYTLPDNILMAISKNRIITFFNKEGEIVGSVDYNGNKIAFEGNMESSGEAFFALLQDIINPFFSQQAIMSKRYGV